MSGKSHRTKSDVLLKVIHGPKLPSHQGNDGLGHILFSRAEVHKNKICQIDAFNDQTETYESVKLRSVRLAIELERRGIAHKDAIAICSTYTMDYIVLVLACLFLGAKIIVIDPTLSHKVIQYQMSFMLPALIFVEEAFLHTVKDFAKEKNTKAEIVVIGNADKYLTLAGMLKQTKEEELFRPEKVDIYDTVLMFFTSGYGGKCKSVCHSHYSFLELCNVVYHCGLQTNNILYYHTFCWLPLIAMFLCTFLDGLTRIICPNMDKGQMIFKIIEKYKVTLLITAPIYCSSLIADESSKENYDLSSLHTIVFTGVSINNEQYYEIANIFNKASIVIHYGIIEVGTITNFNPETDKELINTKLGSCGKPAPGISLKIVDINSDKQLVLGANQIGAIGVKSVGLMVGYHTLDCADFFDNDGFLKTGDIGYYDSDNCVFIIDRIKDTIKYLSDGNVTVVIPASIEKVLLEHPNVKEAVVVSVPHKDHGEVPGACVILKDGGAVTPEALEHFVSKSLSNAEKLRGGLKIVSTFPTSAVGKTVRKEVRLLLLEAQQQQESIKEMKLLHDDHNHQTQQGTSMD